MYEYNGSSHKTSQLNTICKNFARRFDIDKVAKVTGLRFTKKIVGNGDYFEQNTLIDLEPMK